MKRGANDVSDRSRGFVMVWLKRAAVVVAVTVGAGAGPAGAEVQWVHTDAIGNVRALTDQFGTVIERHDLLPFGEEPGAAPGTQAKRFTGKERDVETGLDYFGARYYRANTGRFTTVDPVMTVQANLTNPQRWNRYAYSLNNPLRFKDPDGRIPIDIIWDGANVVYDIYKGATTGDWTDLGADALAMAIPYVPAGASKLRHVSKLDDAIDAGQTAGRIDDPARLLPANAGPTAHISPTDVANKTPAQIHDRAQQLGLQPRGRDPQNGRGAYIDPQTKVERVLSHPNAKSPHGHVNNPSGGRIDQNGNAVPKNAPEAHLPLGK